MHPAIIFGSKQEDMVRGLVNVASSLTYIHNSIENLSERGETRFRLMELELVKLAREIGGTDSMEEVMRAVDILD